VANAANDNVSVINTATNTVIATITVGDDPNGIAITPNGNFVYVANFESANVSVISTSTNTVVATINTTGEAPLRVAISPNGNFVYVTDVNDGMSVISTASNTVVDTIMLTNASSGIVINPAGTLLYVTD